MILWDRIDGSPPGCAVPGILQARTLKCEFVQDHLWVENCTYEEIVAAYRSGRFFCTVANVISDPVWEIGGDAPDAPERTVRLAFDVNLPLEQVEIIGDARPLQVFRGLAGGRFEFEGNLPAAGYYRVRGLGKPQKRAYGQDGEFEPLFLLNPLFVREGASCC